MNLLTTVTMLFFTINERRVANSEYIWEHCSKSKVEYETYGSQGREHSFIRVICRSSNQINEFEVIRIELNSIHLVIDLARVTILLVFGETMILNYVKSPI